MHFATIFALLLSTLLSFSLLVSASSSSPSSSSSNDQVESKRSLDGDSLDFDSKGRLFDYDIFTPHSSSNDDRHDGLSRSFHYLDKDGHDCWGSGFSFGNLVDGNQHLDNLKHLDDVKNLLSFQSGGFVKERKRKRGVEDIDFKGPDFVLKDGFFGRGYEDAFGFGADW